MEQNKTKMRKKEEDSEKDVRKERPKERKDVKW